jgi:hypothetical protein
MGSNGTRFPPLPAALSLPPAAPFKVAKINSGAPSFSRSLREGGDFDRQTWLKARELIAVNLFFKILQNSLLQNM